MLILDLYSNLKILPEMTLDKRMYQMKTAENDVKGVDVNVSES